MTGNPICWFEIYVQDMPKARAFYGAVLKAEFTLISPNAPELWGFPQTLTGYGSGGALARMEGVPSGGNSTLVYFSCEDCAVEAARVEAAGGKVMRDKTSIGPYGFIALAFDPEGNLFGLHSQA